MFGAPAEAIAGEMPVGVPPDAVISLLAQGHTGKCEAAAAASVMRRPPAQDPSSEAASLQPATAQGI